MVGVLAVFQSNNQVGVVRPLPAVITSKYGWTLYMAYVSAIYCLFSVVGIVIVKTFFYNRCFISYGEI